MQVVSRLRRLLHNAHLTSLVCDRWDTACANNLYPFGIPEDLHVSPSERLRFQRAFYHLWTLSIIPVQEVFGPDRMHRPRVGPARRDGCLGLGLRPQWNGFFGAGYQEFNVERPM